MESAQTRIALLESMLAGGAGTAPMLEELAGLRLAAGDVQGAIAAYERCLALGPGSAGLYNNLGAALVRALRLDEAIERLETALALRPGYVRALVNLGKALRECGRLGEARAVLEEALAREPGYAPALVNLGDVHAGAGDASAAERVLTEAVARAPSLPQAHMALGMARLQAGDVTSALDALGAALRLAPDLADAHCNLACALVAAGDWPAAWPHFEHRFRRSAHRPHVSPPPGASRWDGASRAQGTLWLLGEQGLGDQLQFVRYAPLVRARAARVVVASDPRLVRLLEGAELGVEVTAQVPGDAAPGDVWLPLMSLPAWHGTAPATVPAAAGYLRAEPGRRAQWRDRLKKDGRPVLALAWAGNPRMETGRYAGRSPPLQALAPVLRVPGWRFVSLQKGPGEEALGQWPPAASVERWPELDAGPDAFLDTAAVLSEVDLLLTSDTAIAHLAGALGVPTWLCLMHEPDWRWGRQGTTTPWYASMRLFRQPAPGAWTSVYEAAARALAELSTAR